MKLADIKAAVDAGLSVHWANEGYVVRKDCTGEYLITFVPNGSTVGLSDRASTKLNGESQLFFIGRPELGETIHCAICNSNDVQQQCWAQWNDELQLWEVDRLEEQAFCNRCDQQRHLISRPVRDYGAGGPTGTAKNEQSSRAVARDNGGKGESRLSEG